MNRKMKRGTPRMSMLALMRLLSFVLVLCVLLVTALLIGRAADRELSDASFEIDGEILERIYKNIEVDNEEMRRFALNLAQDTAFQDHVQKFRQMYETRPFTYAVMEQGTRFTGYLSTKKIIYSGVREIIVRIGNMRIDNFQMSVTSVPGEGYRRAEDRLFQLWSGARAVFSYTLNLKDPLADDMIRYLDGQPERSAISDATREKYQGATLFCYRIPGEDNAWLILLMKRGWLGGAAKLDDDVVVTDQSGMVLYAEDDGRVEIFQKLRAFDDRDKIRTLLEENGGGLRVSSIRRGDYRLALIVDDQPARRALRDIQWVSAALVLTLTLASILVFSRPLRRILRRYTAFVDVVNRFPEAVASAQYSASGGRSICRYLTVYFTALLCVSALLFSFAMACASERCIRLAVSERNRRYLSKQLYVVESLAQKNDKTLYSMAFNEEIQRLLAGDVGGLRLSTQYLYLFNDRCELNLYALDGRLLHYTSFVNSFDQLDAVGGSRSQWRFLQQNRLGQPVFRSITRLTDYRLDNPSLAPAGYLEIVYLTDYFDGLMNDAAAMGMDCVVADAEGAIIAALDRGRIGAAAPEDGVIRLEAQSMPLALVAIKFESDRWPSFFGAIPGVLALVLALCCALTTLVSWLVQRQVCRLVACLTEIGARGMPPASSTHPIAEIERLYRAFQHMAERIDRLIEDEYASKLHEIQLRNERNESDLAALQAQINPHFLFNVLECVRWLVLDGDTARCEDAISLLGRLLRYSTKIDQPVVRVEEEMAIARTYVEIQKLRLRYAPEVLFRIDEDVRSSDTLRMVLQPLLENAFTHGIGREGNGMIFVMAERVGGETRLCVEDNGAGISKQHLERIRAQLRGEEPKDAAHVGLYNVYRRMQLYFGKEYGLEIENMPSGGVRVTLRQPFSHIAPNDRGLAAEFPPMRDG